MTTSIREMLVEENRILREALAEILRHPNHYAYASAQSHPDTNAAYSHILTAERALKRADEVSYHSAGGSD